MYGVVDHPAVVGVVFIHLSEEDFPLFLVGEIFLACFIFL